MGAMMSMSPSEIKNVLTESGFAEAEDSGIYKTDVSGGSGEEVIKLFFDLQYRDNKELNYIKLTGIRCGNQDHCAEVSGYLGKTFREISEEFSGLTPAETEKGMKLTNGEVEFGTFNVSDSDAMLSPVNKVTIYGRDPQNYCIYGLVPGIGWEEMQTLTGMEEGGSGELLDPEGNVIVMYYSTDPDDPHIYILPHGTW